MPIREKGYYNWEGELISLKLRWTPMFFNGIAAIFRKRFAKMLFFAIGAQFLVFLFLTWIAAQPNLSMFKQLVGEIQDERVLVNYYFNNGYFIMMAIILTLFTGAEQISNDMKFKSFTLYLSRPLNRMDYILGKYSIVMFYYLLFTIPPTLLLILFKMLFAGSFSVSLQALAGVALFPAVTSLYLASIIILLSALSPSGRLVKIMFFIIYMMSQPIAELFKHIFSNKYFSLLSMTQNLQLFGDFLFNPGTDFNILGMWAGVCMLAASVLFFAIIMFRIKRVEV